MTTLNTTHPTNRRLWLPLVAAFAGGCHRFGLASKLAISIVSKRFSSAQHIRSTKSSRIRDSDTDSAVRMIIQFKTFRYKWSVWSVGALIQLVCRTRRYYAERCATKVLVRWLLAALQHWSDQKLGLIWLIKINRNQVITFFKDKMTKIISNINTLSYHTRFKCQKLN